ncbi:MAG: hypothetical protein V3575_02515 [Candidatus Absconditabacteria bacterium]
MVKIIESFKKGLVQGLGFFFVAGLFVFGFYLVKGWNGLQATDGDTLTAAKWNELESNVNGNWGSVVLHDSANWKFSEGRFSGYKKIGNMVCFNVDIYSTSTSRTLGWGSVLITGLPPASSTFFGGTAVGHNSGTTSAGNYSIDTTGKFTVYFWNYSTLGLNATGCYPTN